MQSQDAGGGVPGEKAIQDGTRALRYPVEAMLEYLAGGDTFEDIMAEFPDLEREDVQACLKFAAQSLKLKSMHFVAA